MIPENNNKPDDAQQRDESEQTPPEQASKAEKRNKGWCVNKTAEALKTGHTFMPGLRDMDPDQP